MDTAAKAAFITAMAACCNAKLIGMQEQNMQDRAAGRPVTYQPHDFEYTPNEFSLGHNDVITYMTQY